MKKWLMVVAAVAISAGAFASDGWMTDFAKAKEQAKANNKYILIDFTGSDWCPWCMKLDREVFSQKAFLDYAKDNLVLVKADFPNDKSRISAETRAQNKKIAKDFGVTSFPTVFILDPDGKTIAKTGYRPGGAEAYVQHIKQQISNAKTAKTAQTAKVDK